MLSSLIGLLAPSLLAASFASPLDWSADGRWLAYTIVKPDASAPPKDWLFPRADGEAPRTDATDATTARRATFQAWATRPDGTDSVLIEESRWPLSPPVWGPDGASLYYGRFVAEGDADAPIVRGRYELVARTGLDRGRAIPLRLDLELDADWADSIAAAGPAVSSDGRYVAVPKPGGAGGLWVVRLDQDRVIQSFDLARDPAWSPDGRRLSFVTEDPGASGGAGATRSVSVWNRDRGAERRLNLDVSLFDVPPVWSLDGQSLLAVAAPTSGRGRPPQVDLIRINLETGFGVRVMTLETIAPNNPPRANALRRPLILNNTNLGEATRFRLELSLDREREQALCLVDAGDGQQALKWCNTRTQNTFKRFQPLDSTIRLGAPALSPDGQSVAFRVEGRDGLGLGPPAVCDLSTEAVTLIAPDSDARIRWLTELASRSIALIEQGIMIHGADEPGTRATVLPFPGEFAMDHPRRFRLKRLAKIASGLIDGAPAPETPQDRGETKPTDEFGLLFDYLRGDYRAAEARLDRIEAEDHAPETQLRRLFLRAQILMGQGEVDRARGIADYIDRATASERRIVEETPLGPVVSSVAPPERAWARRLDQRLTEVGRTLSTGSLGDFGGVDSLEPGPDEPGLDGGALPSPALPGEGEINDPELDPDPFAAPLAPLPRPRYAPHPAQGIVEPEDGPNARILPLDNPAPRTAPLRD